MQTSTIPLHRPRRFLDLRRARRVAAFAALMVLSGQAWAAGSPKVYIFDVLRRPDYSRSYNRMFQGEANVPRWFGSAKAATSGTTDAGSLVKVHDGEDDELFSFCEPHNCGGHLFAVLFSSFGRRAVGGADIGGRIRFYGNPDELEQAVLKYTLQTGG